jgi:hypothetical protein
MNFVINVLIVFRITRLIRDESAPFDVMGKFRDSIGIKYGTHTGAPYGVTELSKVVSCPYCLSLWVALAVTGGNIKQALALSGAVSLLYRWFEQ